MRWENLKENRCPECGHWLIADEEYKMRNCARRPTGCAFRIGYRKFDEIVSDLYKPKKLRVLQRGGIYTAGEDENLTDLNNLKTS